MVLFTNSVPIHRFEFLLRVRPTFSVHLELMLALKLFDR